ncbi:hypothetical protein PH505_ay00290 [Pseudoalteromonas distincta]|jgi:hypothetical protein|nr:hypothetical protein PH505_ay00290 [Pseudoalteromonas distincta]
MVAKTPAINNEIIAVVGLITFINSYPEKVDSTIPSVKIIQ